MTRTTDDPAPGSAEPGATEVENDRLAAAANAGDQDAIRRYLELNLGPLRSRARWASAGVLDPDDLLADAITALLGLWAEGRGPTDHPNAYVVRSMRNRVIDERRSPRSRVRALPENDAELPGLQPETREADLHREIAVVRRAFELLPEDQRVALHGTIVQVRKPAELTAELNRPAPAISSLIQRARANLRRLTLRVLLDERAPEQCRRASARLPKAVAERLEDAPDSRGMTHIRECDRCRSAWARFGAMSTAFGVVTLLVVQNVLEPSGAAQAAGLGAAGSSGAEAPPVKKPTANRAITAAAAGAMVVGAGLVVVPFWLPGTFGGATETPVELTVTAAAPSAGAAEIRIDFGGQVPEDAPMRIDLALPSGLGLVEAPAGWACDSGAQRVTCGTVGSVRGTLRFDDSRASPNGERYALTLTADVGGRQVNGRATGSIERTPATVSATAR
ncbi:sigma-70 family RNA polymerase sigma factor [Leucobacter iarius]|uniref:RNA polymerase sigma factor (Sigma-70 family) n=1 Tax=Leucobacter iarius TaxID=333963 RepID=A0ABP4XAX8_9MICO